MRDVVSEMPEPKWNQSGDPFLPLLKSSSRIRQEALNALSIWGNFELRQDLWGPNVEPQNIPFLEIISNVRFEFDLNLSWHWVTDNGPCIIEDTGVMPAGPLVAYTGNDVLRKICVVDISSGLTRLPSLLKPPLSKIIAQLTGFEAVTLDLSIYDEDQFYDGEGWIYNDHEILDLNEGDREDFRASTTSIPTAFEATHGPSIIGEVTQDQCYLRRDIVFHPQAFLASKRCTA